MRIVHFSDWHGKTFTLPSADLYVCTGDMLPNFRIHVIDVVGRGLVEWEHNMELLGRQSLSEPPGRFLEKKDPILDREIELQGSYLKAMGSGYLRSSMSSRDAPVLCCRGNHDFVDLASAFEGGPVFEISDDPARFFVFSSKDCQTKIGGVRGIKRNHARWSDELTGEDFSDRAARLPADLDILVTHSPPEGILDQIPGESLGSAAIRSYVSKRQLANHPLKAHLFGHIHESRGVLVLGETIFSNASQSLQVIEF